MAITKQKKVDIVAKLKRGLESAKSIVFVNFHGLKVADATALRKELRGKAVGLTVAKKTLIRRALAGGAWEGELPELGGEVALAYGEDSLTPAKSVYEFSRKVKDSLKILGGVFEGKYVGAEMMLEVATIPGREELYGKLVYILQSPLQCFVVGLNEISKLKSNNG